MTKSLDQLRRDAKLLRKAYQAGQLHARQRIANYPPRPDGTQLRHADYLDVIEFLSKSSNLATDLIGDLAPPLTILARSKWIHHASALEGDMLDIAQALLAGGADINQGAPIYDGNDYKLSPLYFAIGHANNMALGRWLLENGANPNDGESLYHATELGHHEGLRVLLASGADPRGTNALLRAMDFDKAYCSPPRW